MDARRLKNRVSAKSEQSAKEDRQQQEQSDQDQEQHYQSTDAATAPPPWRRFPVFNVGTLGAHRPGTRGSSHGAQQDAEWVGSAGTASLAA
jgi:hypothetical protein